MEKPIECNQNMLFWLTNFEADTWIHSSIYCVCPYYIIACLLKKESSLTGSSLFYIVYIT